MGIEQSHTRLDAVAKDGFLVATVPGELVQQLCVASDANDQPIYGGPYMALIRAALAPVPKY